MTVLDDLGCFQANPWLIPSHIELGRSLCKLNITDVVGGWLIILWFITNKI